jgi:hypothetical protein
VLDGQPEPKKKRYVYFDQLQFLLPLICDGKERDDEFGNKSFLLSFLPLMAGVPSELAIEARYTITEVFRNISAARQVSLSAISPALASAASPVSIITNVSDTSEENFNILDFCHLQYS